MRGRAGFTLLELLVAVAVLGMLLVLLNQGLQFGLRAQAMQERANARAGDLDTIDRALRQLIAAADPGRPPDPAVFQGRADAVSLVTELPIPNGPARVDATLLQVGSQLVLRWRPHHAAPLASSPPRPQELVLLTGVRALQLAYFTAAGWVPNWTADRLPALVRLQLTFADATRHWPPIVAATRRETVE